MLETCQNCHTPSQGLKKAVKTVGRVKTEVDVCRDCESHPTIKVVVPKAPRKSAPKKATSKKAPAKKAPAKKSTAKKTTAKRSTKAKSTAKRSKK